MGAAFLYGSGRWPPDSELGEASLEPASPAFSFLQIKKPRYGEEATSPCPAWTLSEPARGWAVSVTVTDGPSRPSSQTLMDQLEKEAMLSERRYEGSFTSTLKTLLVFSALMITLPIGLYFSSKSYVFEGTLGMSNRDSYFYAAIVAVVSVHLILALFVYFAWNEGSRQWREGKQD
ncbi:vacuolar ATPase assembly integral membrane protein VMA21-like isoform 1-T1 [Sarcophilus harrisii]